MFRVFPERDRQARMRAIDVTQYVDAAQKRDII
jgi:hypothetical protein